MLRRTLPLIYCIAIYTFLTESLIETESDDDDRRAVAINENGGNMACQIRPLL